MKNSNSDWTGDASKEGEAKINVSLKFQLDLLTILENYHNFYRASNGTGMCREMEMIYECIIDKIKDIKKHEDIQNKINNKRTELVMFYRNHNERTVDSPMGQQTTSGLNSELIMLSRQWKKELIKVMSKNGMLVTHQAGEGGAITS